MFYFIVIYFDQYEHKGRGRLMDCVELTAHRDGWKGKDLLCAT